MTFLECKLGETRMQKCTEVLMMIINKALFFGACFLWAKMTSTKNNTELPLSIWGNYTQCGKCLSFFFWNTMCTRLLVLDLWWPPPICNTGGFLLITRQNHDLSMKSIYCSYWQCIPHLNHIISYHLYDFTLQQAMNIKEPMMHNNWQVHHVCL